MINLVEEEDGIPDGQREIQELKAKLAHLRDKMEEQKDTLTRIINNLEADKVYMGLDIKRLQSKVGELVMESTKWTCGASEWVQ